MIIRQPAITQLAAFTLLLIFGVGLHFAYELIAIGVAYKAKVLCSGVFVSRRSADSVLNEDLAAEDLAPLRFVDSEIDLAGRQVSASFLGLIKQQAAYRADSGCSLVLDSALPADMTGLPFKPNIIGNIPLANPISGWSDDMPRQLDTRLDAVLDWAFSEPDTPHLRRTRAVVIIKNGTIIAERYAPGFSADTPMPGWSVAKSVMNALVGILVGQGKLDLATPAAVAEWQGIGDPRREITLDHLLRMVSGLEFSESAGEPLGDVTRMLMREPDAAAFAASKPLASHPGTLWHYASGTTNIISRMIRQRLGEAEYREFPRRALFGPLGMDSARLETDASGTFISSSFLYATARDWAKFGQLYLQDGVWQSIRILPAGWVSYSSRPTPQATGGQYAAHFWLNIAEEYQATDPEPPLPPDAFHAMGYEGQCVSIVPSKGLVVVRLGLTRKASAWRQDRFVNRIIAALTAL